MEMIQKVQDYVSPKIWTIQEAKEGDVLATDSGDLCLFDGTVEDGKYPFAYCGLTRHGFEFYDRTLPFTHDYVSPATKIQRDLLFQKMKEAGYKWDMNKKELIKLEIMKKDLSIQERKAKAYDEAIKKAGEIIKYYKTHNRSDEASIEDLETIFPELKESENERIKQELICFLETEIPQCNARDKYIDWLEKMTIIIPKFRVGDEIKTTNEESLTITKIDERGYWSEDLFICSFDEECLWDLVNEQSVEPDWCHHKVDFSGCSEEYRKACYDGWNDCNMQHSQRKAELDNV